MGTGLRGRRSEQGKQAHCCRGAGPAPCPHPAEARRQGQGGKALWIVFRGPRSAPVPCAGSDTLQLRAPRDPEASCIRLGPHVAFPTRRPAFSLGNVCPQEWEPWWHTEPQEPRCSAWWLRGKRREGGQSEAAPGGRRPDGLGGVKMWGRGEGAVAAAATPAMPVPGPRTAQVLALQPRGRESLHASALGQAGRQHGLQPRGLRGPVESKVGGGHRALQNKGGLGDRLPPPSWAPAATASQMLLSAAPGGWE